MPKSVAATAAISLGLNFVLYITAEISMTNTGEVNCSTIAFAAVVSLFAPTKQKNVIHIHVAVGTTLRLNVNLSLANFINASTVNAENRLRKPVITTALQFICFITIPAMLHRTLHTII